MSAAVFLHFSGSLCWFFQDRLCQDVRKRLPATPSHKLNNLIGSKYDFPFALSSGKAPKAGCCLLVLISFT